MAGYNLFYNGAPLLYSLLLSIQLSERTIKEKLKALPPELTISFSAIHSNILTSSVTFTNLHIQLQPYMQLSNRYDLYTNQLNVKGIAFLKILLGKTVAANDLQLGKTEITLDSMLLSKKDSAQACTVRLRSNFV